MYQCQGPALTMKYLTDLQIQPTTVHRGKEAGGDSTGSALVRRSKTIHRDLWSLTPKPTVCCDSFPAVHPIGHRPDF